MSRRDLLSLLLLVAVLCLHADVLAAASRYAVLVGVGKYDPQTVGGVDLKSPPNDLTLMQEVLAYHGFGANDMLVLPDEKATREAIVNAVTNHLLSLERGSLAVFYFSGHGSTLKGDDAQGEWQTETIVPYDGRVRGQPPRDIVGSQIYAWTRELDEQGINAIFIFDSCYSGGSARPGVEIKAMPATTASVRPSTDEGAHVLVNGAGPTGTTSFVFLAAGSAFKEVQGELVEAANEWRGVFTGALHDVLLPRTGARAPATWREMLEALKKRLTPPGNQSPVQSPQLAGAKDARVFASDQPYSHAIRAQPKSAGSATLMAGSDLGVTTGSLFKLFGSGQFPWRFSDDIAATARVAKVSRRTAELTVIGPSQLTEPTLSAVEFQYALPRIRITLLPLPPDIAPLDGLAISAAMKEFLDDGNPNTEPLQIAVVATPTGLQLRTSDGRPIGAPIALADSGALGAAVRDRVTDFARWRRLDAWKRQGVVPMDLSFQLVYRTESDTITLTEDRLNNAAIPAGSRLRLSVENFGTRTLKVDAILLRQDFTIDVCPISVIARNDRGGSEEITLGSVPGAAGWKIIMSDAVQAVDLDFVRSGAVTRAPRTTLEDQMSGIWLATNASQRSGIRDDFFWQTLDLPFTVTPRTISASEINAPLQRCLGVSEKHGGPAK